LSSCKTWRATGLLVARRGQRRHGKAGTNYWRFCGQDRCAARADRAGRTLREIIEMMLAHSGLLEHYKTEREGQDRLENLAELVNAAESFVTKKVLAATPWPCRWTSTARPSPKPCRSPRPARAWTAASPGWTSPCPTWHPTWTPAKRSRPLAAFLTHAALESGDNQAQAGQDAVQLMTVHASKGLEFDCVFISGLEEGLFPHENAMSDRDGLEEERRLMYVAITRARKRLYMSLSQTRMLHGQTRYNLKSRFLEELPEAALKWITPKNQGFANPGYGMGGQGGGLGQWRPRRRAQAQRLGRPRGGFPHGRSALCQPCLCLSARTSPPTA
jgi:DNA helicase II / ATP-dependent DNA helicase PcrA